MNEHNVNLDSELVRKFEEISRTQSQILQRMQEISDHVHALEYQIESANKLGEAEDPNIKTSMDVSFGNKNKYENIDRSKDKPEVQHIQFQRYQKGAQSNKIPSVDISNKDEVLVTPLPKQNQALQVEGKDKNLGQETHGPSDPEKNRGQKEALTAILEKIKNENVPSTFSDIWVMVMSLAIIVNISVIPFRLAFLKSENIMLKYLDGISFVIYIINLMLMYFKKLDSKLNAQGIGWWTFEIVTSIPFNHLLVVFCKEGLEYTQYFQIIQGLKCVHLYHLLFQIQKRQRFHPTIFRLINLIGLSFLIAHWSGCIWFVFGKLEGYGVNEWVPSENLRDAGLFSQYLRSLYWGFISTSGIANAAPFTKMESIFTLFLLFMGISMYATIIGNVGSLLSNLDSTAAMYKEKIESVHSYMRYKGIPKTIQVRVHNYYEYLWHKQRGVDQSAILGDLPDSMRTEIALFLNREVVEKVPFFKNASDSFINVIVRLLKPEVFAPGEFIIKFGEVGREMYFINKGVVVVCSENEETIYNVLSDGSFFGEYALLFSQKRTASVKSATYCDLFVLTQEALDSVLQDYPEFANAMRRFGIRRVVEKIELFKDSSAELIDTLVSLLKPLAIQANEYIIRKDEEGDEMYFMCKGTAEVCSADGKTIFKVLHDGDFFGEVALLHRTKRTASVRTVSQCDLFVLTRGDFRLVLDKFPKFAHIMEKERGYIFD